MNHVKIAIIGGGAAGFFTAVNLSEMDPSLHITIYEGSNKLLSKVLISGGGRCNVCNSILDPESLAKNYPRGNDFLANPFKTFGTRETQAWFESRGVPLKTEADGRVFPQSNSSQSIYNCLTLLAKRNGVTVKTHHRLEDILFENDQYHLKFNHESLSADYIVLATGSNPSIYRLLQKLDIKTVSLVPSLFTLEAKNHLQKELAGVSVPQATIKIVEIKDSEQKGPLLITHWGYTGPSVLRLSAWQARSLHDKNYHFTLSINWLSDYTSSSLKEEFELLSKTCPKDKVISWKNHGLPKRLWMYLIQATEIKEYTNWSEIGKKGIARLSQNLTEYTVFINKKSTYKEEFVTAGGIDLNEVHPDTFKLKKYPRIYAAGEILDIDAITGGFNFQAAWTGGFMISKDIARSRLTK